MFIYKIWPIFEKIRSDGIKKEGKAFPSLLPCPVSSRPFDRLRVNSVEESRASHPLPLLLGALPLKPPFPVTPLSNHYYIFP